MNAWRLAGVGLCLLALADAGQARGHRSRGCHDCNPRSSGGCAASCEHLGCLPPMVMASPCDTCGVACLCLPACACPDHRTLRTAAVFGQEILLHAPSLYSGQERRPPAIKPPDQPPPDQPPPQPSPQPPPAPPQVVYLCMPACPSPLMMSSGCSSCSVQHQSCSVGRGRRCR